MRASLALADKLPSRFEKIFLPIAMLLWPPRHVTLAFLTSTQHNTVTARSLCFALEPAEGGLHSLAQKKSAAITPTRCCLERCLA